MKLIIYTLTPEGNTPNYVTDGGYFPWANGGTSPQDLDLIGVADNLATETNFVNEAALLAYAGEKNFVFKDLITKEIIPLETVVSSIWNKLE